MIDQPPSVIFKGLDLEEAELFIIAIRSLARNENKLDDDAWMADLASTCVRGRAMSWHAELDESCQRSWYLLVRAINAEWPHESRRATSSANPRCVRFSTWAPEADCHQRHS